MNPEIFSIVFLIVVIVLLYMIDHARKVKYLLNGKLINQHTMSNLLQNAVSLNHSEKIKEYLIRVGKLIQFGYQSQHTVSIEIAEEIACCNHMIEAYNELGGKTIILEYECRDGEAEFLIAPFTLTLLVENALKYGFADNSDGRIILRVSSNRHAVQVDLSGYSIPEKKMISSPNRGHGLHYLKDRINFFNYYHGGEYLDAIKVRNNSLVLNFAKVLI
jgi:LytS/YehU family sensor histidine kinase